MKDIADYTSRYIYLRDKLARCKREKEDFVSSNRDWHDWTNIDR